MGVLCKAVEDIEQLGEALRALAVTLLDRRRDALFDVKLEDHQADAIEGRLGGRELLKDLDAQPRLLDHPADAADLPLDPVQPGDERLLL